MNQWPGKLLLFGEYTVLLGGEALALPLHGLSGRWQEGGGREPDERLQHWHAFLAEEAGKGSLPWPMDLEGFGQFIRNGGRFDSAIPTGCGLGSSGALVAALAARWSPGLPDDLTRRREGLARLESHFHGNSSGLDPLVSLQRKSLHLLPDGSMRERELPPLSSRLFLLDSRMPRQTAPLVDIFRERVQDPAFLHPLQTHLLPRVSEAIAAVSAADEDALEPAFREIGAIQARHFGPMVPDPIRELWTADTHELKLCGAGGGGFFLGLSRSDTIPELPFPTVPLTLWTQAGQR